MKGKNMKIEVLLSCMNQKDFSITEKMNLTTDILIVNQCNENKYEERIVNGKKQRMIYTTQRGLSQSRNELLNNMEGDIGIFCDDDVIYEKDYEEKIKKAYDKLKDSDVIVFDTIMLNNSNKREKINKIRKAPKHKNYGSVRITFKKNSFYKKNLVFNRNFGSGSKYSCGEDSLLFRDMNNKRMKIYEYPEVIATVDYSKSTWFQGYNKKFFYDKGAWLKEAYPWTCFIFKWYYIFKFGNRNIKRILEVKKWINQGINEYN